MGTNSDRMAMWLPDDGVGGTDDDYNVTLDLSDNLAKLDSAVGLFHCTAATHPTTNNFIGRLIKETDTGTVLEYNGSSWDVVLDTKPQAWDTPLKANNIAVTLGSGGYFRGYYKRTGKIYDCNWFVNFGTTGFSMPVQGIFTLDLPTVTANAPSGAIENSFNVKTYAPLTGTIGYLGYGFCSSGSQTLSLASMSDIVGFMSFHYMCQTDGSGGIGTGIPRVAGNYSWTPGVGGNISVWGRYISV